MVGGFSVLVEVTANVMLCAGLMAATACGANVNEFGVRDTVTSVRPIPNPVRLIPVGLFDALLFTVSEPDIFPKLAGVKITWTLQVALMASVVSAQLSVSLKLPAIVNVEIVTGAVPVFCNTIVCAVDGVW